MKAYSKRYNKLFNKVNMRLLIIFICFAMLSLNLSAQDKKFLNKTALFIDSAFMVYEMNPSEKVISDSINKLFKLSLNSHVTRKNSLLVDRYISKLFRFLYKNGNALYSDRSEERRFKLRRSVCFASIALLSDSISYSTFIDYAKLSLYDRSMNSSLELLEESYLGLLFVDLFLKYENKDFNESDLNNIERFIEDNR